MQLFGILFGAPYLFMDIDDGETRYLFKTGERNVLFDIIGQDQAVTLAVLRCKAYADRYGIGRVFKRDVFSFEQDFARYPAPPVMEEAHDQFCPPRADQARHTEDLAFTQDEIDIGNGLIDIGIEDGPVLHLEDDLTGSAHFPRVNIRQFTADHEGDQLILVELFLILRGDRLAVTQDGDAVGEVEDLFQAVGDVDTGDALFAQVLQDPYEPRRFAFGKGRGS